VSWILFRSVARLYLTLLAGALVAILVIFLVGDFADRMNAYLDKPLADVGLLYWHKLHVALHQLAPAAMLLAAAAAVSILRKRGEWTAMRALGMSRWVLVAPIGACALLASAGLVAFDEWVVTHSGTRVDRLMVERFQRWGDFRFYYFPKQWFRVGDWIIYVRGDSSALELRDVTLLRLGAGFTVERRLDADVMCWEAGDTWALQGATERRFGADGATEVAEHPALTLALPGSSADTFRIQAGRPELMRVADLRAQLAIRGKVGLPTERLWLALHNRFAYPLTGFAAAMLAAALALRRDRRGHLTVAIVEGLVVTLVLFSALLVGKALVLGEHLPAPVAAWAPPVGLLAASLALWARAEGLRPQASARR
jgi:lipopolysaccharide export system permease protein